MGFGLILSGYIFAFVARVGLGDYIFAGMLLGGFLMYLGFSELKQYSPVCVYSQILSVLIFFLSVFGALIWMDSAFMLELGIGIESNKLIYEWLKFILGLLFNVSLLYGIIDVSNRVDYPETKVKAMRNLIFVGVFNLFQLLMLFPIPFILNDKAFFNTLLLILQLIYSVLNATLLFKCYAMICPAGQEDMPRKPSRFAFVNKMRAIRDAKEEKAIEDMKNYYEEKLKSKNAKKKSKKKKKK